MTGLIRAEFRKLFTTQVWFWLLLVSLGLTALNVLGSILGANDFQDELNNVHSILASASAAGVAAFVLGVLSVTTEFRYQTITPTVLATPSRWTLITAKLISSVIMGVLFALACTVIALAMALPWLSSDGISSPLSGNWSAVIEAFIVVALYALLGLGAGALLKNQIVAVVVGLIFLIILQNIVVGIPGVKRAYPYLPGGLERAITTGSGAGVDRTVNDVHLLPVWGGIIGFVIWGVGMAVLGAGITMNRDIT
jgi:ABC-2 type transport system permease protein